MILPFARMHGAANDFVVLEGPPPEERLKELVVALCDRQRGVGGDGALWMERIEGEAALFRMHFYNCDGNRRVLCLNGSRCLILRAAQLGWVPFWEEFTFLTDQQEIRAAALEAGATLWINHLPPVEIVELPAGAPAAKGWRIDTGDPHLVVEVDRLDPKKFDAQARALRHWKALGSAGSNVHFVERGPTEWKIRSFERGIEAETLACGSGCVAAWTAMAEGIPQRLKTGGGDHIELEAAGNLVQMSGPAVLIAEGQWFNP